MGKLHLLTIYSYSPGPAPGHSSSAVMCFKTASDQYWRTEYHTPGTWLVVLLWEREERKGEVGKGEGGGRWEVGKGEGGGRWEVGKDSNLFVHIKTELLFYCSYTSTMRWRFRRPEMRVNTFLWLLVPIVQPGTAWRWNSTGFRPSLATYTLHSVVRD